MNVDGVKIAIRTPLVNKVDSLDIANSKIFECLGNRLLADIREDVGDIETDVSNLRRHFRVKSFESFKCLSGYCFNNLYCYLILEKAFQFFFVKY